MSSHVGRWLRRTHCGICRRMTEQKFTFNLCVRLLIVTWCACTVWMRAVSQFSAAVTDHRCQCCMCLNLTVKTTFLNLFELRLFVRPFVKRVIGPLCPVCPVCLSVLSVTFMYCGQTVGWIKMKLRTEVGLSPGHSVLDGDPAPLPKGAQPPIFGTYVMAKRLDESRCHLVRRQASALATLC